MSSRRQVEVQSKSNRSLDRPSVEVQQRYGRRPVALQKRPAEVQSTRNRDPVEVQQKPNRDPVGAQALSDGVASSTFSPCGQEEGRRTFFCNSRAIPWGVLLLTCNSLSPWRQRPAGSLGSHTQWRSNGRPVENSVEAQRSSNRGQIEVGWKPSRGEGQMTPQ